MYISEKKTLTTLTANDDNILTTSRQIIESVKYGHTCLAQNNSPINLSSSYHIPDGLVSAASNISWSTSGLVA